mmetsp:Transcript_44839/g.73016  ORF Transcript_44839/g.73016 Transcript_44839/m.73016 type:complete len:157 (-) Transcript_44839:385-855(-)
MEFLSARQLISLHKMVPELSDLWNDATWKQQLLHVDGETPQRDYRHCFKIEVGPNLPYNGVSSEMIEVFGSRWFVNLRKKSPQDKKLSITLIHDGTSTKTVSCTLAFLISNKWMRVSWKEKAIFEDIDEWRRCNCVDYDPGVALKITILLCFVPVC